MVQTRKTIYPSQSREATNRQTTTDAVREHHSPLEGESANQGRSPPESRWGEVKRSYSGKTLSRAKSLRRNQTDAESLLWHYLRNKQLDGYKFRRQQPIGPYIIDFACLPEKSHGRHINGFLATDGRIWRAVIKSTGDGSEMYLKTFHKSKRRDLMLARKRWNRVDR